MPSAVFPEAHKELTVRQILHHLGFFASDVVLENEICAFLGALREGCPGTMTGVSQYCFSKHF